MNNLDKRIKETYIKNTSLERMLDIDSDNDGFDLYYNHWLSLEGCTFLYFTQDNTYLIEYTQNREENPDPIQLSSEEEMHNFLSENQLLYEFSVFQAACDYQLNKGA